MIHISAGVVRSLVAGLVFCTLSAHAANVSVVVTDGKGALVEDAAIHLEPMNGKVPSIRPRQVDIAQKDRKFMPAMTVIQVGQPISFPNNDSVRHHVYSLSQAKLFELKLYSGVPSAPVVFDKPGTVAIGCNIHDKMIAYIRVVESPWFGKTDAAGHARIDGVPEGQYKLRTWHSGLSNLDLAVEQLVTITGATYQAAVRIELRAGAR